MIDKLGWDVFWWEKMKEFPVKLWNKKEVMVTLEKLKYTVLAPFEPNVKINISHLTQVPNPV